MDTTTLHRPGDLTSIDPDEVAVAYDAMGLDRLSDAALVARCAAVVDRPKQAPPDSFVLHAPLELMARAALLGRVAPAARRLARQRLVWFAATYAAAGPAVAETAPGGFAEPRAAGRALADAITAGDMDRADESAAWLARHMGVLDLVGAMVDVVTPSLAGAAHGGIFLHQLLSFAGGPSGPAVPGARAFARELARNPDWQLSWFAHAAPGHRGGGAGAASPAALVEALRRPPSPGPLDNNFIHPTMHLTESSGLAAAVLGPALDGVDRTSAATALLRMAALSMLQDDPAEAPYGWSHCLTMPHGLLAVAPVASRPDHALAVAATYVLGFRATQGTLDVDPDWVPEPVATPGDTFAALEGTPDEAAAAAWHAGADEDGMVAAALVDHAATHPDAHLAKYTLACLQQATADPEMAHLYLAAAAYLGAWWRHHPVAGDPLL